jgi:NAD+ kinase
MMRKADLVVVLGGDGSLLGMARLSQNGAAPVVGLHHGDFGFLTESERGGPNSIIAKILDGDYEVEQRTMLAVEVKRNSHVVARAQALNDAVVARGTLSRMVTLEASVDGEYLATYKGDGLVIATPTGSTAYSLSAGGPVVEPNMSAILLTPISPHTLSSRPLVLSDRSSVAVRVVPGSDDVMLSIDGQESIELESDDVVEATKSRHRASIVKASGESFFGILRRKLSWGVRGEALERAGRRRRE